MREGIIETREGFWAIIALRPFRRTEGVSFDILPGSLVPKIDAVDRVLHRTGARSPGATGGVERPWYMHPSQDDNLMVLAGERHVDIWRPGEREVATFSVYTDRVERDGAVLFDGPAMLVWPRGVFHRIVSGSEGSASVNFATRYEGWSVRHNFDIFSLDVATGRFQVIREGWKDQAPEGDD
jgi:hypothetical protein